jgi:hypothetical protein
MRIIIESQWGWRPNEDMKMSSAPSFGAPGGYIFDVVALGLKKHVFKAMLAQHVASEPRMHLWTSRCQTDRNTPSRLKIDFWLFEYNGFLSYNGYNGFWLFLPFFDMFEVKIGGVQQKIDCQWGWRPNEDMKMSQVPSFGAPGCLIFIVVASQRFSVTLYQPKLGLAYPQKSIWKKNIKIFEIFILTVCTI